MSEKLRAVVIDDVELCRDFLADVLEDRGYQVKRYTTGHSFPFCSDHDQCRSEHPCADLLITDNQMPLLSGLELVEQLRGRGCKLPSESRAVISGSWTLTDREKAAELGCKTFDKPYDLKGINDWLTTCEGAR